MKNLESTIETKIKDNAELLTQAYDSQERRAFRKAEKSLLSELLEEMDVSSVEDEALVQSKFSQIMMNIDWYQK